ncbi:MAG: class F sortase [Kocuria sp.]|nr:class F sortase [Kocuria sp.]
MPSTETKNQQVTARSRRGRVGSTVSIVAGGCLCIAAVSGFVLTQNSAPSSVDQDGVKVTSHGNNRIATTDEGKKYAPRPVEEFRNESCPETGQQEQADPGTISWDQGKSTAPLQTTNDLSLPDAPAAAWYSASALIGSDAGHTVVAGHVDHTDNDELSPFGHLHEIQPCSHIAATDEQGRTQQYVVTSKYTQPQQDLESTGIFSTEGDPKLALVTCSGPSVADAGGSFRFHYKYNLIVEATPIGGDR